MGKNKSPAEHDKEKFVWDNSAKGGAVVIGLIVAGLAIGVLNKKSGPESPASGVLTSVPTTTENVTPSSTNEEIFALFQEKIKNNSHYTPTRAERMALAQLGIAVNDGAPIPYAGDGNEEQK